ncbi:cyclophilin family peptidyl-prolyl cis-trans isomerase [Pontibacter ummariensis]|uniref:peptidylprolyl isomerase n=1 Tax=Pontibacter ummariensis TaxID=1610492 RepID=A0A239E253_9BACT|nr:peptidylprolyl isomerase [Pontibacter ummariensis]PRY13650.1 cyclophilin family peptidyl-prolyl cis-trans isomerase [Pontibacter ummariensis]SNS38348.1 Peptidyl-prolyl cis-trans isomerase (rotamase) -cyclophilin family [Pontibacter ummariensis]
MKIQYTLAFALATLSACQYLPFQRSKEPVAINKFGDAELQRIYTLQDERNTNALLPYLNHAKPQYRTEAALAFASVQDTLAVPALLGLLNDTTIAVREAAAYALGQIGHEKAEMGLIQHLSQEQRPVVQAELLEALGKIATPAGATFLASYAPSTPVAQAGKAWGLYRAGLRQQYTKQGVAEAVQLLSPAQPYEARLAAAHFLARTPKLNLTPHRQDILTAATSDEAPEVRMAATLALGRVNAPDKASFLSNIAQSDADYRVRLSAVRAMAGQEFEEIKEAVLAALQDDNINTAVATAEFLQANPTGVPPEVLLEVLPQIQDARVRGNLIWVLLHNSLPHNRTYLNQRYKQQYQYLRSPYEKAQLLRGLSGDYNNFKFIADETFTAQAPVVSTTGIESLILMRQQPDFPRKLENEFAETLKRAVGSGDVALTGIAAAAIRDQKLKLRSQYRTYDFLTEAQQKLELPRDMETNIELQKTIDYLSGKEETEIPQNPFTHPIDWALVKTIPVDQQVLLRTEKGNITLQLFVEDAPGSVANFVELTKQDFFDSLYFHRVVPNFVAQGGDKRGDGWGSSDYSIRSEFAPLHYREGYVGMASAGKDTESNQWFITHSSTPHLDGRYTIFAKVVDGMPVVHQLEVGDRILDVELVRKPVNPGKRNL